MMTIHSAVSDLIPSMERLTTFSTQLSIAVAVSGIALSFFYNIPIAAILFGILGAVVWFQSRQLESAVQPEAFDRVTAEFRKKEAELIKATTDLRLELQKVQIEKEQLAATERRLAQEGAELKTTLQRLQGLNVDLSQTTVTLLRNEAELRATKEALEKQISDLRGALALLSDQMDLFASGNVQFGKDLGALQEDIVQIGESSAGINAATSRLSGELGSVLTNISKQIATAQTTAASIFRFFSTERDQLTAEVTSLRSSVGNLEGLNRKIASHLAQIQTLTDEQRKIEEDCKKLLQKREQEEATLATITAQVDAQTRRLEQVSLELRGLLDALEARLKNP